MNENLAKIRHERSKKDFPDLALSDSEYVEMAFKRAKICLFLIVGGMMLGVIMILLALLFVLLMDYPLDEMGKQFLFAVLFVLLGVTVIAGLVAIIIYNGNRLFITNERVIQHMKNSILSSSINTIDLFSVEDVSFHKDGIMQNLFRYGTLRLATVGDETTYTFKCVNVNAKEIETISKMISDAKARKREEN